MIERAGGSYIFDDLGDEEEATSTVSLQMEEFYAGAKDADYIIYNSTIEGELSSIDVYKRQRDILQPVTAADWIRSLLYQPIMVRPGIIHSHCIFRTAMVISAIRQLRSSTRHWYREKTEKFIVLPM